MYVVGEYCEQANGLADVAPGGCGADGEPGGRVGVGTAVASDLGRLLSYGSLVSCQPAPACNPAERRHQVKSRNYEDLRRPESILEQASSLLDFDEPVAVLLGASLHFLPVFENSYGIVERLMRETVPGSYLVVSHVIVENPTSSTEPRSRARK
ncbi:SAM-dependent methyltransferase [Nonomuraea sp. NPDC049695]|uniref:SAM-dependent methyltransferase n=1 Tax=Nonomuraea sp. NPDC049695 TaxID=3154734 RepID=UPI00341357CA